MPIPLREALSAPFTLANWRELLAEIFPGAVQLDRVPTAHPVPTDRIRACREFGRIQLADNRGLVLLEIEVGDNLDLLRNRVELRNLVARFIDQDRAHGVLAMIRSGHPEYRLTFAARVSGFDSAAETFVQRETATRRFTYVLGPGETRRTAGDRLAVLAAKAGAATLEDVIAAFDVEPVSDEFFARYKDHYAAFCQHLLDSDAPNRIFGLSLDGLEGKALDHALKPVRDFVKKLLGRLVFLHFLQKKGWLGCPAEPANQWTGGTLDFLRRLFDSAPPAERDRFHSARLVPLFFDTLNNPHRANDLFAITGTRVPYLNGGLFERDFVGVEQINFPEPLFAALLEFFGQYHFTIDENDPEDHEIGIDPEMLGHIFENLLEDNKDKGAYYTPKAVVQYMCQQSLIHALTGHFPGDAAARGEIEQLIRTKEPIDARQDTWLARHAARLSTLLDELRICDPAIGSGAFPIGLLQEIYWTKLAINSGLDRARAKRDIIQRSIHGVDLDAGAVEIARLRFWLALIVEESAPVPLPNLDYQIMQGNSLLESFEGERLDDLDQPVRFGIRRLGSSQDELDLGTPMELVEVATAPQIALAGLRERYYACHEPEAKARLRGEIDTAVLRAIDARMERRREELENSLTIRRAEETRKCRANQRYTTPANTERKLIKDQSELDSLAGKKARLHALVEDPRAERPFFLWHLWFRHILDEPPTGCGGFDIVIANPPYISHDKIPAEHKLALSECYTTYEPFADIYCYFLEQSTRLLKVGGIGVFITSNSYIKADYGRPIRLRLGSHSHVLAILNIEDTQVFKSAIVNAAILTFANGAISEGCQPETVVANAPLEIPDLFSHVLQNGQFIASHYLNSPFWVLADAKTLEVKARIELAGTPLDTQGAKIRLGIATGNNEAFVIDETDRQRLGALDERNLDIIKPILRGRDIGRYSHLPPSKYILLTKNGVDVPGNYPTLVSYFDQFGDAFKKRGARGQNWWNLRACAFYDDFELDRIVWIELSDDPRFALCEAGTYLLNTAYFILPPPDLDARALLGILNSALIFYYFKLIAQTSGMGTTRWFKEYVSVFPTPQLSAEAQAALIALVDRILAAKRTGDGATVPDLEAEIDAHVFRLYGLTPEEIELVTNGH